MSCEVVVDGVTVRPSPLGAPGVDLVPAGATVGGPSKPHGVELVRVLRRVLPDALEAGGLCSDQLELDLAGDLPRSGARAQQSAAPPSSIQELQMAVPEPRLRHKVAVLAPVDVVLLLRGVVVCALGRQRVRELVQPVAAGPFPGRPVLAWGVQSKHVKTSKILGQTIKNIQP